jgi:hypothetical protein
MVAQRVCSGWEADALIAFKDALGLEDADAAEAHVEVGRTIFRMRSETGSRVGEMAERGQFQKLVFLSNLVFGEAKARFLLPWKRLFNVSDAQVRSRLTRRFCGLGPTQPEMGGKHWGGGGAG